jgi:hypothetical protein
LSASCWCTLSKLVATSMHCKKKKTYFQ